MSNTQNEIYEESTYEYSQEPKSKAMQAAERLPFHERKFNELEQIKNLIGDLADAFAGKPINYEREFTANTRTPLAEYLMTDEINFQSYRPE